MSEALTLTARKLPALVPFPEALARLAAAYQAEHDRAFRRAQQEMDDQFIDAKTGEWLPPRKEKL